MIGFGFHSCVEYTPKPSGYVRIEPETPSYKPFGLDSLPFCFDVSEAAIVELKGNVRNVEALNIAYPNLEARLYCSYLPISSASLMIAEKESRSFVARQVKSESQIAEKAYSDPEAKVYGSLFLVGGESASPIQFYLTDSVSHFFRGALYFDCKPNADSLAPAVRYIRKDIVELIQTFRWRE